jgi:hypothetical protein
MIFRIFKSEYNIKKELLKYYYLAVSLLRR